MLIDPSRTARLEQCRDAMFSDVHINTSENRAVLHTALRYSRGVLIIHGHNDIEDVHAVLDTIGEFTDRLRIGEWTGATGERIKTVINITPAARRGPCPTSTPSTWWQRSTD